MFYVFCFDVPIEGYIIRGVPLNREKMNTKLMEAFNHHCIYDHARISIYAVWNANDCCHDVTITAELFGHSIS